MHTKTKPLGHNYLDGWTILVCINTLSAICNGEKVHKNFDYDSAKKPINIQKLEVVFNKLNTIWHLKLSN